jgi:putative 4-mercaptohistidine N1-methyltranferase
MSEVYENPKILDEYLLFHYGKQSDILDSSVQWPEGMKQALDFAVRTPRHFTKDIVARGLDLGCAVGRSSFEMSRTCEKVIGLDYSHQFIDAANRLKNDGSLDYTRLNEASIKVSLTAELPLGIDSSRVEFIQGDAMHLPEKLGRFDRVHAANLLCRLTDPILLLNRLSDLLDKNGELVLATPCTWLEEFTPRGNWPKADTLGWLKDHLLGNFELRSECDEPFIIRETSRKFQWTRSLVTVWKRR